VETIGSSTTEQLLMIQNLGFLGVSRNCSHICVHYSPVSVRTVPYVFFPNSLSRLSY
jgi:hypothetical protein